MSYIYIKSGCKLIRQINLQPLWGIEKKIQNCQIELKARQSHALSGNPKLYKGTASGEIWQ